MVGYTQEVYQSPLLIRELTFGPLDRELVEPGQGGGVIDEHNPVMAGNTKRRILPLRLHIPRNFDAVMSVFFVWLAREFP